MSDAPAKIITVTLNPAIDRTLWIDEFAAGKVNRVVREHSQAAGKGVNVAVMLADMGAPAIATGVLGKENAAEFQSLFASRHIEDRFIRAAGATRVGLKIVSGEQTTDINVPGLRLDADAIDRVMKEVQGLAQPGRWFVLSGSIPAGVDQDIYARLIDLIHAGGGRAILDSSGEPLKAALAAGPDVLKPNIAELSELTGNPLQTTEQIIASARGLIAANARGPSLVVVSMGGDGAMFVTQNQAILAEPPHVTVESTVGAGDAMVAGIVMGMSQDWPLQQTAMLASALGTYTVTRISSGIESPDAWRAFEPKLNNW